MNGDNSSFPRKYAQSLKQAFSVLIKIVTIDHDAHIPCLLCPTCPSGTFIHSYSVAVEPRFNEPLFNEVLDITNDILCPGQSYSKRYGIES